MRQGLHEEYWDLKLGMSQNEVMYVKGAPDWEASTPEQWLYGDAASTFTVVLLDAQNKVFGIVCIQQGDGEDCPAIAGVGGGSEESEVLRVFGSPFRTEVTGQGVKFLDYGTPRQQIRFSLEKGEVVSISVGLPRIKWNQ